MYSVKGGECELFFAFFCICLVDSQEMAFPVTLWCLNVVLNFVTKSAKVPRVNDVPEMALWQKVAAQVRAHPLVMYERAKAILAPPMPVPLENFMTSCRVMTT